MGRADTFLYKTAITPGLQLRKNALQTTATSRYNQIERLVDGMIAVTRLFRKHCTLASRLLATVSERVGIGLHAVRHSRPEWLL